MKVVVATTQDLFVRGGGATYHAEGLAAALAALGHEVETVRIPFGWRHKYEVLRQAYQWRMLDLRETGAGLVITLKFPAFYVHADRKRAWVLHQHRPLYDNFDRPEYSAFSSAIPEDVAIRDAVVRWDTAYLGEMERIFTNSRTVADRLREYNGLEGEPLYHPPPLAARLRSGPFGDYVLWVGRLEANKRPGLLLEALAFTKSRVRAVFAGWVPSKTPSAKRRRPRVWKGGSSCAASSPRRKRSDSTPARERSSIRRSTRTSAT